MELEQAQCSKRRTRLIRELQAPKDACADSAHEQSGKARAVSVPWSWGKAVE